MSTTVTLIISILTYLVLGFYLYSLGKCSQGGITFRINNVRVLDPNIFMAVFLFALICGLRYNCGADCENYVANFEYMKKTGSPVADFTEPLFTAFSMLIAKMNASRVLFLGIIAFVEAAFLYSALYDRRYLLPFFGLVLVLGPHFLDYNNGLRQMMVTAMFFYALQQAVEYRRIAQFIILVLVGITIHYSSAILILAFPLIWYNRFVDTRIAVGALCLSLLIANLNIIDPILENADGVMYVLGYNSYADNIDYYIGMDAQISRYGPRRIAQIASYLMIMLYGKRMDIFYKGSRFFRVSYLLFVLFACLYEMLALKNLLFTRPLLFLSPFWLLCSAYLLHYLHKTRRSVAFWISTALLCSYSILASLAEYQNPDSSSLYRFVFFQDL